VDEEGWKQRGKGGTVDDEEKGNMMCDRRPARSSRGLGVPVAVAINTQNNSKQLMPQPLSR
jgi:hypothetical protein